jgi:hypothetical protein
MKGAWDRWKRENWWTDSIRPPRLHGAQGEDCREGAARYRVAAWEESPQGSGGNTHKGERSSARADGGRLVGPTGIMSREEIWVPSQIGGPSRDFASLLFLPRHSYLAMGTQNRNPARVALTSILKAC